MANFLVPFIPSFFQLRILAMRTWTRRKRRSIVLAYLTDPSVKNVCVWIYIPCQLDPASPKSSEFVSKPEKESKMAVDVVGITYGYLFIAMFFTFS